ncbi:MAG: hypothetical protein H9893_05245 [Candidatus Niameybacter stercoravium]|nr:hypothetical protein [Candidatus Niameybacter stercoravium]
MQNNLLKNKYFKCLLILLFLAYLLLYYFLTNRLKLSNDTPCESLKVYATIAQPALQNIILEEVKLPNELANNLLNLITTPTYYKARGYGYINDETVINIGVISNISTPKTHYYFSISDLGTIHIQDVYNKKNNSFYSLKPFYNFLNPLFMTSTRAEKTLYSSVFQLISDEYLKLN